MAISSISASHMAAPSLIAPHQPLRAHPSSLQLPRRGLAIAAAAAAAEVVPASRPRRGKLPPVVEKIQKFPSFADLLEKTDKLLLVEFYTTWCVPCELLGSNLIKAARLTTKQVQVVRIDVDKNHGLAAKFGIKAVPSYIIFKDGKQVDRFEGAKTAEYYVERLQRALKAKEGSKTVQYNDQQLQRALKTKEGAKIVEYYVENLKRALKEKEGAKIVEYYVENLKRALKEKVGAKTAEYYVERLQRALKAKECAKTVEHDAQRILEAEKLSETIDHDVGLLQRDLKAKVKI